MLKKIDSTLLNEVSEMARESPRKRMNFNFHPQLPDPFQRLLNAIEPYSYIQPHKHENPDRCEVFVALRGRFVAIEFDDYGNIADHMLLDPVSGNFAVEIPERVYHSIIGLDKGGVVFEFKQGPFIPKDDRNAAPWAPKEGEPGAREYLVSLLQLIDSLT